MPLDAKWYAARGVDDYDEIKEIQAFGWDLTEEDEPEPEPEPDYHHTLAYEIWELETDQALRDSEHSPEWRDHMEELDES